MLHGDRQVSRATLSGLDRPGLASRPARLFTARRYWRRPRWSIGFKARDHEPSNRSPCIDRLLRAEARPRSQVGKMTLRGARPNAHQLGRIGDGSTNGNEGCQHVHLARRRLPRQGTTQVSVPHASRLAANSHSSRPSIGIRQVVIPRPTPVGRARTHALFTALRRSPAQAR